MRPAIGHFRVPPRLCFKTRVGSAFDMEIIFHSHANKTHFHKKGCAPSLILKVRVFGTRKWPIICMIVTEDEPVSYWRIFFLSLLTVPKVFAKVNRSPGPLSFPDMAAKTSYENDL